MSSGEMSSAPKAVGAAVGEVPVATVAAAAVLAVRAANAAAPGVVRMVAEWGADGWDGRDGEVAGVAGDAPVAGWEAGARDGADGRGGGDGRVVGEAPGPKWEAVAAVVVELCARIRMLGERGARAGVAVAAPEALNLAGLSASEAARWAVRTAGQLRGALAAFRLALAEEELRRVASQLPHSVAGRPDALASLASFQRALLERYSREATASGGLVAEGVSVMSKAIAILWAVDPDANEKEHAYVLSAAALVLRDDPLEARAYLRTLRAKVDTVNEAVAQRRLAAQWLLALEEPVVAAVEAPGPFLGIAARLRAVVTGDEDLTADLRARGAEAVEWAAEVTRHRFLLDVMSGCLSERDYTVDGAFDVQEGVELRLTRPDWHGEHSAEVWMDRYGAVHGRMVREKPIQGDRSAEVERTRCASFNAHIRALGLRLRVDVVVEDCYVPRHRATE